MNKKIALFALAVVVAGSAGSFFWSRNHVNGNQERTVTTLHSIYGKTTPEELFQLTDGIVLGTVENLQVAKIPSRLADGKQDIVTNASIRVEKYLKNPKNLTAPEITVQTVGGTLGNQTMFSDDSPSFEKGQRVVVFLHQEPDGVFTIFRWGQGKYTVSDDGQVGTGKQETSFFNNVFGKDMTISQLETEIASASAK